MNQYFYDFEIYQSPSSEIPDELMIGDNARKLLVVISEKDFSDDNRSFLSKILAAVSFQMEKDASVLILKEDQMYSVSSLMISDRFSKCLLFGLDPKKLGFSIETFLYAPFEISGKGFTLGHSLEKIKASTEYKKALWAALQALFNTE